MQALAGHSSLAVTQRYIEDEGGTLEAPWESGVNWSLANTSFAYIGEDGNNYTISLVQGSLSGLAGGEGDDTLTGTAADERFNPHAGDNVVTGGGGWDTYRFNDADGHTLITDYATGERIQFDADRIGFDVDNLTSEITTEYSDATDQTKLYVQSATVARHHIATVNGEFVIANREYDARWDDVNVQLVEAELQGDNTIVGTDEDDTLYGFDGNDVLDGRGGEDRFWGGAGDDSITFGADTVTGEATRGDYYSEAGNDQIDMGGEWGWLRYDEVAGSQRALINFTGETLFFVEEAVSAGSDFITLSSSSPQGDSSVAVTELDSFSVRDQFGDVDSYLNTEDGAHFWGTALDDVFVTSKHFWWSATAGNDQIIVIGDEGGTLEAPWESGVNWSLANTSFAYIGEDGNNYTISLVQGSLSGLAGGEGDDTLTGTAADERFNPHAGDNVVTGGGGWDTYRFNDADGHTLITDYATGERIQFDADRIGFDVDNLTSEITTEYSDATDQTKLYVQSATVARHHIATVNGEFVIANREYDARWDDVNVQLVEAELQGDNTIVGTDEDDTLYGFDGNDVLDGRGGEDRFWGGAGDDKLDGGAGNDTLEGGAGSDTFVFRGTFDHDVITDFDEDNDSLEFYSGDGTTILASELVESTNSDDNKVLSTADGLSSVTFVGQSIIAPTPLPFDIVLTSESDGVATFEIYANELVDPDNDGIGSFEFTLSHDPADLVIYSSSIVSGSGYSGVPNYDASTGVLVTGGFALPSVTDFSIPIATFSATVLDNVNPIDLTISDIVVDGDQYDGVTEQFDFSSVEVESTIIGRGAETLNDVRVSYDFVTPSGQQKTIELPAQAASKVSQAMERGVDLTVTADKDIDTASEDAIGAYDALQALRLAVGLTKSDGTAEWHDYLAADINKDGRVGADDALDILKFAVGLTDGAPADWIFVDGDADWSGIDRRNTDYDEGIMLEDVLVDTSINMTGILVGDLDGSYVV